MAADVRRKASRPSYEFRKNQYVLLNDEDFDSVRVESSSVMTIEKFVETDSIDPATTTRLTIWRLMVMRAAMFMPCSARLSLRPARPHLHVW